MPARPPAALRAGLAAAVAVLVAMAAHSGVGGAVDLAGAGWAFAALVAPSWWLTRRERGWPVLAVAQLAAQQAAHLLLNGSGDVHAAGPLPMDLMLHVHLLAAAFAAVWLRVGERRAWAAARATVRGCLLLVAPSVTVPPPATARPVVAPPARRPTALLQHVLARRGPPLPAA